MSPPSPRIPPRVRFLTRVILKETLERNLAYANLDTDPASRKLAFKDEKDAQKLPKNVQKTIGLLLSDLVESGPIQKGWNNFSALAKNKYHCHLTGSYVACWSHKKGTVLIEVYYVGSREDAPY